MTRWQTCVVWPKLPVILVAMGSCSFGLVQTSAVVGIGGSLGGAGIAGAGGAPGA